MYVLVVEKSLHAMRWILPPAGHATFDPLIVYHAGAYFSRSCTVEDFLYGLFFDIAQAVVCCTAEIYCAIGIKI